MLGFKQVPLQRRTDAFTILELLVVIGIIMLLAALLFPVFASARRSARMTTCTSNLHQIDLALRMYLEDYNGALPLTSMIDTRMVAWDDPIKSYTKNADIYHCPEGRRELLTDYAMRSANLPEARLNNRTWLFTPDNVLAYCESHLFRDITGRQTSGEYVVLRGNGSVKRIPVGFVPIWWYHDGVWHTPEEHYATGSMWPVFPDETWPPRFSP